MNILNSLRRKFLYVLSIARYEPLESILDADYIPYTVAVIKFHNRRPYYIINAGTETAARYDRRFCFRGIKKYFLPGTGHLHGKGQPIGRLIVFVMFEIDVKQNLLFFAGKITNAQGRGKSRFP